MRLLSFVTTLLAAAFLVLPAVAQSELSSVLKTAAPPSLCEQVSGLVTLVNFIKLVAVIGIGGACIYLFRNWLIPLCVLIFGSLPTIIYEVVGYTVAIACMFPTWWLSAHSQTWASIVGSLFLAGMLYYSGKVRNLKDDNVSYFGILALAWGFTALVYADHYVGFMAVGAFMGAFGFAVDVMPFGYAVGYNDAYGIKRGTLAAFTILGIYSVISVFGGKFFEVNEYAPVFATGALWWGGVAGYIGLIILSSRWYPGDAYWPMQILTFALCWAAVGLGALSPDLSMLFKTGYTAMGFYFAAKYIEILPKDRTTVAFGTLFGCGALFFVGWHIEQHADYFKDYVLFLS